jgi:hypothetical protein
MLIEFRNVNNGGQEWIDDDMWKALEAAGWKVDWSEKRSLRRTATKDYTGVVTDCPSFDFMTGMERQALDDIEAIIGDPYDREDRMYCDCCDYPYQTREVKS